MNFKGFREPTIHEPIIMIMPMGQVLQSGATFVTKWGYYYKSSAVQKATETNGGGQ